MTFDKSCPGARTIREPVPEDVACPNCGKDVEIWTDELKATCRNCGHIVLRAQQASCIDWCPHAKDCVGPEAYERLKSGTEEDLFETGTPLESIRREHERVLDNIGLLKAAGLCLKLGTLTADSPVWGKGIDHLAKVLDFFDKDVGLHFRREEELLFPALEKHLGVEKSPTRLLMAEHAEMWQDHLLLKEKLAELQAEDAKPSEALPAQVQQISGRIEQLLREHIRKEDESLLTLAKGLLSQEELDEISARWKTITVPVAGPVKT
ncbi:MAG: hemerythrin domain-containing protein [Dehalococcoidales bacterium]|mgnify:FL=1|nr:hemerythrin domain-containing protein [Dehalococcoidales bacterium]